MAEPTTRAEFKEYCLRRLGKPVIDINVDDDQLEDRIDDAIEFFQEYHFDGVEKLWLSHKVTGEDITNKYVSVGENIIGITRLTRSSSSSGIFDVEYQLRLNDYVVFGSTAGSQLQHYWMKMEKLSMIENVLSHEPTIRFNRKTDKLHIDWSWGTDIKEDEFIVMEAYQVVVPSTYGEVWKDRLMRDYCTALFKEQWGMNLSKFEGVQLPGGVTLNGRAILEDAKTEIAQIKETASLQYELPVDFYAG